MPQRRVNRHQRSCTQGLALEADDVLLPGLSPETFQQRLDEFRGMNEDGALQASYQHQNTLLLPSSRGGTDMSGSPSSWRPEPPPPPPPTSDGTSQRWQRATNTVRNATVIMSKAGANRPLFIQEGDSPLPPSATNPSTDDPFADIGGQGGGGLPRVASILDQTQTQRRKSTMFPGGPGDGVDTAEPPSRLQRRGSMRGSTVGDGDGSSIPLGGNARQNIRRGSTFSGPGTLGNTFNPNSSSNGMVSLEHQLFRGAPSTVLAKLSGFVNNRNGDGGSWQRLSDLIDMHRKGHQMSLDLEDSMHRLKRAGDKYPHKIIRCAEVMKTKGTAAAAVVDSDDEEEETTSKNPSAGAKKEPRTITSMVDDWQDAISTASSLTANIFGLLANTVPTLLPVCETLRKIMLTSIYHNGRNLSTVVPIPSSIDACASDIDFEKLKKKMELFSVDPFAIISVETDVRKVSGSGGGIGGHGVGSFSSSRNTVDYPLMQAVKTERQLRKRFEVLVQFLTNNLTTWKQLAMTFVLRSWASAKKRRVLEEGLTTENNNLRAELEYVTNSKKTQAAELARAVVDRTTLVADAEAERTNMIVNYQKTIASLEIQVSNLKQLVQSLKKNSEAVGLREDVKKLQDINETLEARLVKVVEHIAQKETQAQSAEQRCALLTSIITAISTQLSSVTGQLGASVQEYKGLLTKLASLATGGSSIPPLASWLMDLAQVAINDEELLRELASIVGSPGARDRGISLSASDIHNPAVRQSIIRVRDFTEGAQVLDAYLAVMYTLDKNIITAENVAFAMCESDLLSKAEYVIEYANLLFTQGSRLRVLGNVIRNPASFISSNDIAYSSSFRPHLLFVSSLLALWISPLCSVSLVPMPLMESAALSRPMELEKSLDSDPVSTCTARWETVKEAFVIWRNAMLSLPSLLVDYTAEATTKSVVLSIPTWNAFQFSADGGGGGATPSPSTRRESNVSNISTASAPQYVAQRRQSQLVRASKSVDERMLLGSVQARNVVVEAVRSAQSLLLPIAASTTKKRAAVTISAPADDASLSVPSPSAFAGATDEDRLQSTASSVMQLIEDLSPILSGVFRFYAVPTSEHGFHSPVLIMGFDQVLRLCEDIGAASGGGGAITLSSNRSGLIKMQLQHDDCKEIVLSISRKRSANAPPSSSSLSASPTKNVNKKTEESLRAAVSVDEFAALLVRIACRCCCSTPQSALSSDMPLATTTDANNNAAPQTSQPMMSIDAITEPQSAPSSVVTAASTHTVATALRDIEVAVSSFLETLVLPLAYRVDPAILKNVMNDASVSVLVDENRQKLLQVFQFACSKISDGVKKGKSSSGGSSLKTAAEGGGNSTTLSQAQFNVLFQDLISCDLKFVLSGFGGGGDAVASPVISKVQSQPSLTASASQSGVIIEGGGGGGVTSSNNNNAASLSLSALMRLRNSIFIHSQPMDVQRPLLMSFADFQCAVVAMALGIAPNSHAVHPSAKFAQLCKRLLDPFRERKGLPDILPPSVTESALGSLTPPATLQQTRISAASSIEAAVPPQLSSPFRSFETTSDQNAAVTTIG